MLDTLVGMQRQIALGFFLQGVNRQWGKLTHAGMHAHICAYTYCVQGTVLGFERCSGVWKGGEGAMCHHINRWNKHQRNS